MKSLFSRAATMGGGNAPMWAASALLLLMILPSSEGYASFSNADAGTIASVCETLSADHAFALAPGQSARAPFSVSLHLSTWLYTPGTTKDITVTLKHVVSSPENDQLTLKGFIVQARKAQLIETSTEGVGTWIPGDEQAILECDGGSSTAIVQANGTVGKRLPITLVYRPPANDVGPIRFVVSLVQDLTTYMAVPLKLPVLNAQGACEDMPCKRGGTCVEDPTDSRGHICMCGVGITGDNCDEYVCLPNPCGENKKCILQIGADTGELYRCACNQDGHHGDNCEFGPCDSDPCQNGGTCQVPNMAVNGYFHTCQCPDQFFGHNCDISGACLAEPCQNNGICSESSTNPEEYMCDCSLSLATGANCEIDACVTDSNPQGCKNGGTCVLRDRGPSCSCPVGFFGEDCSVHLCDLSFGPCNPINERCVPSNTTSTGYYCDCTILFIDPPECTMPSGVPIFCTANSNPCLNGGTCSDYPDPNGLHPLPFDCTCTQEFKGDICDTPKSRCELVGFPCLNGGVCNEDENELLCTCMEGYSNTLCQDDICAPGRNPCENGGSCTATSSPLSYTCACTPEYKGQVCNIPKSRCELSDFRCQNGGVCNDNMSEPLCTCTEGFSNTYCQDDVMPPVIQCRDSVIPGNGQLSYSYMVDNIPDFEVTDNSGGHLVRVVPPPHLSHDQPPYQIEIGPTNFTIFALDFSGNQAICQFQVYLTDTIPPNVTCPSTMIVTTMPGERRAQVQLPEFLAADNYADVVNVTSTFNDTKPVALGSYEVVVIAEDEAANQRNCSFWLSVEAPQLLYVTFAVDEDFSENYVDPSHPDFKEFEERLASSMLAEIDVTDFGAAYAGMMINSLNSGSVEVDSVLMMNSLSNMSDPNTFRQFVDALNASIRDDGMLGNMSIMEGSLMVSIDICMLTPCQNDGVCMGGTVDNITCDCANTGYEGALCEDKIDFCLTAECQHGGTCTSELLAHRCDCTVDYTGDACEIQVDHCAGGPCQNEGTCTSNLEGTYTCTCTADYEGDHCETRVDPCVTTPCQNGGTCKREDGGTYSCNCTVDWTGGDCEMEVNHCADQPCLNSGVCRSMAGGAYTCDCTVGFVGDNCETEVDYCADTPCQNSGVCTSTPIGYSCDCSADYTGDECQEIVDHCAAVPCRNGGECSLKEGGGFSCGCTVDYTGDICEEPVDHCGGDPCLNSGVCTSLINGAFSCNCAQTGFTGDTCNIKVDPCNSNPCLNSGNCSSVNDSYTCACSENFEGTRCQTPVDPCVLEPCNGGTCSVVAEGGFHCVCLAGFIGDTCNVSLCEPSPCENNGTCRGTSRDYECMCPYPYTGRDCIETDYCSPDPCLNDGVCSSGADGYMCNCTGTEYGGTECEIDLTPCDQTPCLNDGACLNLILGEYNCTCDEVKWSGTHCEIDLTPCDSSPCLNNGTCQNHAGGEFNCTCDEVNWTGPLCEIDLMPCSPNSCSNDGVCTELEEAGKFSCACNETEWTGPLCDIDVTPCDPVPCLNGGNCTRLGPGNYSCECAWGFDGPDCEIDLHPCQSTPCLRGGTCRNGTDLGTYVCDCAGDWVGVNCESIGTVCNNDPCENGATCRPTVNGPTCECTAQYEGDMCTTPVDPVDECASSPCLNGGSCINLIGNYACTCTDAFSGFNCETNGNDAGAVVSDSNSSWWIIALCICFLVIIGIAAACVCVSMSKKASS